MNPAFFLDHLYRDLDYPWDAYLQS